MAAMTDECWLYEGYVDRQGYGKTNGKLVHRLTYEAIRGPIPKGLVVDHLCKVTGCYNPFHMELVTPAENTSRDPKPKSTHCSHGHIYDDENTRVYSGKQHCRTCDRERHRSIVWRQQ